MNAFRSAGRLALAACAALALVTGVSAEGHAATGNFTYTDTDGVPHTWADPPNGECISFGLPAVSADNETNATATVYENTDCSGAVLDRVPPKSDRIWGRYPNAVRFNFL
ncbi:hypothetical protein [Streptomyces sp. RPT161]|uniref:hypothetical protein n=1 Tax=Streptomyces sp. RPT161 TaxID=3015993 RepID=UPI0022B89BB4|nr:hypothetical protein [Streptomyces sp. RPT161]